jgi:tellurite resistance protein TerC
VNVPAWVWLATIVALLGLLAVDLFIVDRNPHQIRMAEAARWVAFYVVAAIGFGAGVWTVAGSRYAGEFFAGYLTEYSLSVDNLFVFVLILTTFAVPGIHQHRVLLFGVLAALVLRGLFIAAGAAVIAHFQGVFYLFGAFLIYTGWRLAFSSSDDEKDYRDNRLLRMVRRVLPVTDRYHGTKVSVRIAGRRHLTPMLLVMLAIGSTDLMFALDSIPAIFGLTKEPYLVFTANAFALMGLRQLFFLLGGLLERLVYLSSGLALILGFIGIKLILEALHGNGVRWAPHVGIELSLGVIAGVLVVTTLASLAKVRRDPTASVPVAGGSSGTVGTAPDPDGQPEGQR